MVYSMINYCDITPSMFLQHKYAVNCSYVEFVVTQRCSLLQRAVNVQLKASGIQQTVISVVDLKVWNGV